MLLLISSGKPTEINPDHSENADHSENDQSVIENSESTEVERKRTEVKNEMPQSIGIVKCIELRNQQRVYVLSIDSKDVYRKEWLGNRWIQSMTGQSINHC